MTRSTDGPQVYTDARSTDPRDFCNCCHRLFYDVVDAAGKTHKSEVYHQTLKNKAWLATIINGTVQQECCEECVQEVEDMVDK